MTSNLTVWKLSISLPKKYKIIIIKKSLALFKPENAELGRGFTLITVHWKEFWCGLNGYKSGLNQHRKVTKYIHFRIHLYLNCHNFTSKTQEIEAS